LVTSGELHGQSTGIDPLDRCVDQYGRAASDGLACGTCWRVDGDVTDNAVALLELGVVVADLTTATLTMSRLRRCHQNQTPDKAHTPIPCHPTTSRRSPSPGRYGASHRVRDNGTYALGLIETRSFSSPREIC
jgi:hypothetical protein